MQSCNSTKNQTNNPANVSSTYCCDSTLYKTICDYFDILNDEDTPEAYRNSVNILLVYDTRKFDEKLICLAAQPCYSFQYNYSDSVIVSYTIIRDWLIRLDLTPEVFNKYKASFTFIDPNQFPQYQKNYDGSFEPISWQYRLQNDSLIFDKKVYH